MFLGCYLGSLPRSTPTVFHVFSLVFDVCRGIHFHASDACCDPCQCLRKDVRAGRACLLRVAMPHDFLRALEVCFREPAFCWHFSRSSNVSLLGSALWPASDLVACLASMFRSSTRRSGSSAWCACIVFVCTISALGQFVAAGPRFCCRNKQDKSKGLWKSPGAN